MGRQARVQLPVALIVTLIDVDVGPRRRGFASDQDLGAGLLHSSIHPDLIFSDFQHGAVDTLHLIAFYLPRVSDCSSIFIDSASTLRQTYELLEQLIPELNAGNVPVELRQRVPPFGRDAFDELVRKRRFNLMHLTEVKPRAQNSMAWIKIEPRHGGPYPLTGMREF